jgi:hypothetical protein
LPSCNCTSFQIGNLSSKRRQIKALSRNYGPICDEVKRNGSDIFSVGPVSAARAVAARMHKFLCNAATFRMEAGMPPKSRDPNAIFLKTKPASRDRLDRF